MRSLARSLEQRVTESRRRSHWPRQPPKSESTSRPAAHDGWCATRFCAFRCSDRLCSISLSLLVWTDRLVRSSSALCAARSLLAHRSSPRSSSRRPRLFLFSRRPSFRSVRPPTSSLPIRLVTCPPPPPFRVRVSMRLPRSVVRRSPPRSSLLPRGTPFSLSFFLLALLHSVVYSLLVTECPAQAFLVREQANFEGFASISVQTTQQSLTEAALAGATLIYISLARQRTQKAEDSAARANTLDSLTQPPSLSSLAGSVSGTHVLGVFAFLPSGVGAAKGSAKAAANAVATFVAACV